MFSRKLLFVASFMFLTILAGDKNVSACEICTIPRLGRQEPLVSAEDTNHKWFFEFLFEEQNWDELDPTFAHNLHHAGHHVHDKTREYFFHFNLGRRVTEDLSVTFELPYVVRHSLGVEHANLGNKETSEGFGDLNVMASYRTFQSERAGFSLVGGVKLPTGETDQIDSTGALFEPELQPASGSWDFLMGGIFEHRWDRVILKGNATYSFKTEGEQDYTFGDLFSTSLFADYVWNPDNPNVVVKTGMDINYQYTRKDEDAGVTVDDSGGHTIFVGPTMTLEGLRGMSVFGTFLYPVLQDPNGVHQKLDFVWTLGGKLGF